MSICFRLSLSFFLFDGEDEILQEPLPNKTNDRLTWNSVAFIIKSIIQLSIFIHNATYICIYSASAECLL